jgi:Plasmid encoded RepA protein
MGTVHDLLERQGKKGAIEAGLGRELVEAAASYMSDEDAGLGFVYSGWAQCALPHRRLADEKPWQIVSERVRLVVEPGRRPGGENGDDLEFLGVPYGSHARLILLFLQTEALRTGLREVELGRSMRQWLERMGVAWGGTSGRSVRDQAERISRCRLTFHLHGAAGKTGLVEILSPSNRSETWTNVWAYTTIPSVQEILVLHSTAVRAEMLRRDAEGNWPERPEVLEGGTLELLSIGLQLPLAAAYAGTRFDRELHA